MKKPKRPLLSDKHKASIFAVAMVAMPLTADAASLGRLSVWSGLGQPLRAEVDVVATPEEQPTLIARIATPEMYRQAGLEYNPSIASIRVLVDRRGPRPVIRISSDQPIRESFLDILIELSWANGRLSREYTVLLDPVDLPAGGSMRGAPQGNIAPPVNLPDARMSYNLSQRGAGDSRSIPPPGPQGLPPLLDSPPRAGGVPQAKPLPSLKPNYANAPSEARLTPATPAVPPPLVPAPALDPRSTAKPKSAPEVAAAPATVPVLPPAPVAQAPVPAPLAQAIAPEPRPENRPAPSPAQAPVEPLPRTAEKAPQPRSISQIEEELRAAERAQAERRLGAVPEKPLTANEKALARKQGKAPSGAQEPPQSDASNTYAVQRGDTLSKIARETKPEEVSLEQMLVALFRNNESAFEGNMNRLKAGRILVLPEPEKVMSISKREARRQVIAQSADFAAYRSKLAELARAGHARDDGARQSATGKIAPRVEETAPAPKSRDQLKLTRTLGGKDGKEVSETARKAASEEDRVASDRAVREANARVAELEQNIKNLQSLIELKNRSMAEMQRHAKGGQPAAPGADVGKKGPSSVAGTTDSLPMNGSPVAQSGAAAVAGTKSVAQGGSANAPQSATTLADKKPAESFKAAKVDESSGGVVLSVLGHPAVWGGALGLAALIAGWFGLSLLGSRSKLKPVRPMSMVEPADSLAARLRSARENLLNERDQGAVVTGDVTRSSIAVTPAIEHPPLRGAAPAVEVAAASVQPVQTEPPSVRARGVDSVRLPATTELPTPGDSVEAVSLVVAAVSADDSRAVPAKAEIAPVANPVVATADPTHSLEARTSIHLELLRLYAQRRELEQFDALAHELCRLTQGEGADWMEAVTLGRAIDPENSLYQSVAPGVTSIAAPVTARAPAPVPVSAPVSATTSVSALAVAPVPGVAPATPDIRPPAGINDPFKGVDFDFGDFSPTAPKPPQPLAAAASGATPQPVIEAENEPDDESPAPIPPKPVDLTDVTLDLQAGSGAAQASRLGVEAERNLDEVSAKVELARAYQEMGDIEGARELLTEVLHEGDGAQQNAAREALNKLG